MADTEIGQRLTHLLNELRNTLLGVQVLLAGLVTVPFTPRFPQFPEADRLAYLAAVGAAVLGAVFLITPSQYHRLRHRYEPREETLGLARTMGGVGSAFLATALASVLFLLVHQLHSEAVAGAAAGALAILVALLWFVLPLAGRR